MERTGWGFNLAAVQEFQFNQEGGFQNVRAQFIDQGGGGGARVRWRADCQ